MEMVLLWDDAAPDGLARPSDPMQSIQWMRLSVRLASTLISFARWNHVSLFCGLKPSATDAGPVFTSFLATRLISPMRRRYCRVRKTMIDNSVGQYLNVGNG
ncbi:hypothetical protein E8E14_002254 [Neopestalotiopsis sp. 37M]|nr:hypothetical protein E8E14_002254 [Neopestalotiopsis sp. 37M]